MNKNYLLSMACLALACAASPAKAATIAEVGITGGSTLPGSATDYIFFTPTSYQNGSIASTADSNLNSFTVSGGYVAEANPNGNSAVISSPGGGGTVQTGDVDSSLYASVLGQYIIGFDLTPTANPTFNYNNFNVYVMFSNNTAHVDSGILLGDSTTVTSFADYGVNNPVADGYVPGSNVAQYIEYNVQGYGSFLSTPGNALVLGAEGKNNSYAYVSGLSFQSLPASAPEPSTNALLVAGVAVLGFLVRRKGATVRE